MIPQTNIIFTNGKN